MKLTDARAMRALAHPLRIELFERLAIEGSATASDLAPLVGSTPSNCSFHLRTLAEAGFIERVPGHTGRQRPWRAVDIRQRWDRSEERRVGKECRRRGWPRGRRRKRSTEKGEMRAEEV